MIRILYDFDIDKINNCKYFDRNGHVAQLTSSFTSELLKANDSLFAFQYLGGGYDSVCFVENKNQSFYIIEPANGLIVSYQMIERLVKFENEIAKKKISDFTFGSVMSETAFRPHRNDDEIMAIGKIEINKYCKIGYCCVQQISATSSYFQL